MASNEKIWKPKISTENKRHRANPSLSEKVTGMTHQNELKNANIKVEDLERKMERQEQYSMRNCTLIHGLKEEKIENTYDKL